MFDLRNLCKYFYAIAYRIYVVTIVVFCRLFILEVESIEHIHKESVGFIAERLAFICIYKHQQNEPLTFQLRHGLCQISYISNVVHSKYVERDDDDDDDRKSRWIRWWLTVSDPKQIFN